MTNIAATNFKGRGFKNELAPITVFVGENFAGKSSRMEAMTLAIAGYLPGIEKRPSSIHERLASDSNMNITAAFDGGQIVVREYEKDKEGSVKCKTVFRGLPKGWAVEPVLVDADEFLGLSEKERVKFLFNHIQVQGDVPTPDTLFGELVKCVEAQSEQAAEIISAIRGDIDEDHQKAVESGLPPQEWLQSLFDQMNDKRKEWKAEHRAATAAEAGASQDRVEVTMVDLKSLAEKLEKAESDLAEKKKLHKAAMAKWDGLFTDTAEAEERAVQKCRLVHDQCKRDLQAAKQRLAEVQELDCCPKCGAKNKGWRDKIEQIELAEVQEHQKALEKAQTLLAQAQKTLAEKKTSIEADGKSKREEQEKLVKEAEGAEEKASLVLDELLEQKRKAEGVTAEIARRQKGRSRIEKLAVGCTLLENLCNSIQSKLDEMIASSIDPFLSKVNALCQGLLLGEIAYHDGELGMFHVEQKRFVSWRSFSGTEKLLFTCGVQIALAENAEVKIAFLEEIGRLDEAHKAALLARVNLLVENNIIWQAVMAEAGNKQWWFNQKLPLLKVMEITN